MTVAVLRVLSFKSLSSWHPRAMEGGSVAYGLLLGSVFDEQAASSSHLSETSALDAELSD